MHYANRVSAVAQLSNEKSSLESVTIKYPWLNFDVPWERVWTKSKLGQSKENWGEGQRYLSYQQLCFSVKKRLILKKNRPLDVGDCKKS